MVKINKLYILYRIDYVFNKNEDILLVQRIKLIVNMIIRRKKIILGRVMKAKQSKIEIFVTGGNIQDTGCPNKFTPRSEPAMLTEIQELQCYEKNCCIYYLSCFRS